jgi:hypothetical protein
MMSLASYSPKTTPKIACKTRKLTCILPIFFSPRRLLRRQLGPQREFTDWRGERATDATKTGLKPAVPELDAPAPVQCSGFGHKSRAKGQVTFPVSCDDFYGVPKVLASGFLSELKILKKFVARDHFVAILSVRFQEWKRQIN